MTPIDTTRLPPQVCPACLKKLDAVTPITNDFAKLRPNDYTVCLYCQEILQFDADMILQVRTLGEVDPSCRGQIVKAIVLIRRMNPVWKASKN